MDGLVGVGFRPLDEEIIDLLNQKRLDPGFSAHTIKEIDFYSFDPWELPRLSEIQSIADVWYFFYKPKYICNKRKRSVQQQHRKTKSGTWKMTGNGCKMKRKNSTEVIGDKNYLVFVYDVVASEKANTEWVMHEISVANNPLYKENFVVCRLARKNWVKKLGVSTTDEHQSSQDFASCSSINVVEDIFLESAQPPDPHLVSKTNHVVENIVLKTQLPPSENLFFCNEDSAITSLDSGLSPRDCLISHSGNHVAENTFLEAVIPATQQLVSNRNHVAENNILVSQVLPSDHLTRNHVAENTSAESQLPPSQNLVSYSTNHFGEISAAESQLLASQDLISYSRNHVAEIASLELQQPPNHLISYYRNHVAENTSTGLQLIPHDILESLRLPDQQWAAYSINVVENSLEAEPRLLAEFNTDGGFSGLNNDSFLALQSPTYLEKESSYANGPIFGCDLLNSQFDSEEVIAFSELQQLPNHLISYSRNHVAKNSSTGLQQVPHDILESQILPNKHWAAYSTNVVENSFEAEPGLLAEFITHGVYNGLNPASFSALQSPIYPEQESFGSDLFNSKLDSEEVIAFPESQQLPNLISYSQNHVAKSTPTELQLVPHDTLESLILPNQYWAAYSTDTTGNSFGAETQLFAEVNTHGGYNGLNNASFSTLQSPIFPEQESSYSNGPSYGGDFLNSQLDGEQVDQLIKSQRAFQNEHSREETGQITPDFNYSKLDGGVYEVNSSDIDTEAFNA